MLGLSFSYNLDWGSYIISIARTTSKKIGALIYSMKFLFPVIALYLNLPFVLVYSFIICRHVCVGAPGCYLEMLDKLKKWVCRTVGPSLVVSPEPLSHR